jgi:hypothetical protein
MELERPARVKHSILLPKIINYGQKKFYDIVTWPNVIKLFTAIIYRFLLYARVLVPGRPFQLSLLLMGKAKRPTLK